MAEGVLVLHSGGIKSSVLLAKVIAGGEFKRVETLYINMGQPARRSEKLFMYQARKWHNIPYHVHSVQKWYKPDRRTFSNDIHNAVMFTVAATVAKERDLAAVYSGGSPMGMAIVNNFMESFFSLQVYTPYRYKTLDDIVQEALIYNVDLSYTSSCVNPGIDGTPCDECESCRERNRALTEAGLDDIFREEIL